MTLQEHIHNEVKRNLERNRGLVVVDVAGRATWMSIKNRDWFKKIRAL